MEQYKINVSFSKIAFYKKEKDQSF